MPETKRQQNICHQSKLQSSRNETAKIILLNQNSLLQKCKQVVFEFVSPEKLDYMRNKIIALRRISYERPGMGITWSKIVTESAEIRFIKFYHS